MHNNLQQTNVIQLEFFTQALCWEYYSKIKNCIVIHLIKHPNFEFKNEKKTLKISESGGFFQILTHDDYEQINGIQLELFYRIKYHTLQRS